MICSKDWLVEYSGYTTAISGKRQEMDSELVCPTPEVKDSYLTIKIWLK